LFLLFLFSSFFHLKLIILSFHFRKFTSRPAGNPQEPQAKKPKTDIAAATEISQDSSKTAKTETEPETAA
jgi:hypothetical protein